MHKEYDFSQARRAKDVAHLAKFQEEASRLTPEESPVTVESLRRVLRGEFRSR